MFKIFISALVGFILLGCGAEKSPSIKSNMFQSVSQEKAVLVQEGKDKGYCVKCGMNLVKFYKTSHASEDEHKHYQYCSIHCLEDHLGEGVTLKNPKVVDINSLKLIPVSQAYYVVGSKKRATMSRVSKYAFSTKSDALKFQALYGGDIMDFNGAREKAQEDFKHYKN